MESDPKSITPVNIEDKMQTAYMEYAMSVIVGRALPNVRDGLKPVHRRILYAMHDMNAAYNRPYMKSARVVGEVIGKYHPHGDSAVYDAIVRMKQEFAMRNPLINGQGNFGSVDGDSAAAMRYTEVRLHQISHEFLEDIDKDTVGWVNNYDESLQEPEVLPTKVPNLLINGSTGIAVGMATNIPPHNLTEVAGGLLYYIDHMDDCVLEDILPFVQGPDFPTAGIIMGREGILSAYRTGRGLIRLRAKTEVEIIKNSSREAIIVTELPYAVNKARLIEKIAELVKQKRIEGIQDLRDESDREGMRIVVELKKFENTDAILANLYKHTAMQSTFGAIMLAVADGQPKVLPLLEIFRYFVDHRIDVILRRTRFELQKAEARAHILKGLKTALNNIDDVVQLIRSSPSGKEAKSSLMEQYELSEEQAQAILEMRLQRLTELEIDKLDKELQALQEQIDWLKKVLADEQLVLNIIKEELIELRDKYGEERKSEIVEGLDDIVQEDLIPVEDMVVTMSKGGYIKRCVVDTYRLQNRGGKGKIGMSTKEEDILEHLFIASTHDTLLIFTNHGKVYWKRVFELPAASRTSKGRAWVNLLPLSDDEKVMFCTPITEYSDDTFVVMLTEQGTIKKTALTAYQHKRANGTKATLINEGDRLSAVRLCRDTDLIFIATQKGMALKFPSKSLRPQGRVTRGCRGIKLKPNMHDKVISMEVIEGDGTVLTVTENGFGKKSSVEGYRLGSRGNMGVLNIKSSDRIGHVVDSILVDEADEIMMITQMGKVIRLSVDQIRSTGRVTQGVRLINLKDDESVVSVAKIVSVNGNGDENEHDDEATGPHSESEYGNDNATEKLPSENENSSDGRDGNDSESEGPTSEEESSH
jgi:DNA gyrase subunit A